MAPSCNKQSEMTVGARQEEAMPAMPARPPYFFQRAQRHTKRELAGNEAARLQRQLLCRTRHGSLLAPRKTHVAHTTTTPLRATGRGRIETQDRDSSGIIGTDLGLVELGIHVFELLQGGLEVS